MLCNVMSIYVNTYIYIYEYVWICVCTCFFITMCIFVSGFRTWVARIWDDLKWLYASEELKHRNYTSRIIIAKLCGKVSRPTLDHAELDTAAAFMFGVALQPIKDESTKAEGKDPLHFISWIIYPVISGYPMTWRRSMTGQVVQSYFGS